MISRRIVLAGSMLAAFGFASAAKAGEIPFTPEVFAAAQKAGKHILVAVHADWCPVCKQQKPIIDKLSGEQKFKNMTILRVDFDSQKPIVQGFKVQKQSTLIIFKGEAELARSTGDTKADSIEQLLGRGI